MWKLFKYDLKEHRFDLIEFYGVVFLMLAASAIWFVPLWGRAVPGWTSNDLMIVCLGIVQFSIFAGLISRLVRDLLRHTSKIQYILAPIKQDAKIVSPIIFYIINFIIADMVIIIFITVINTSNMETIAVGLMETFILSLYGVLIFTLVTMFTITVFNFSQFNIPAFISKRLDARRFRKIVGILLVIITGEFTILIGKAAGKFISLPGFTMNFDLNSLLPGSNLVFSINTLPYIILGIIYIYCIYLLCRKNTYME